MPRLLDSKVRQLQHAIVDLSGFLEGHAMDCYFNNLLLQLDKISQDVNTRLEEVTTFYSFLTEHQVETSTSSGYFSLIPDEVLLKVFSYLDERELSQINTVNKHWKRLSEDEFLWKRLYCFRWRDGGNAFGVRLSSPRLVLPLVRPSLRKSSLGSTSCTSASFDSADDSDTDDGYDTNSHNDDSFDMYEVTSPRNGLEELKANNEQKLFGKNLFDSCEYICTSEDDEDTVGNEEEIEETIDTYLNNNDNSTAGTKEIKKGTYRNYYSDNSRELLPETFKKKKNRTRKKACNLSSSCGSESLSESGETTTLAPTTSTHNYNYYDTNGDSSRGFISSSSPASPSEYYYYPKRKDAQPTSWKKSYIRRRNLETNWRGGIFKVKTYPGHTSTRVRCLQFDDDKLVMGSFDQKCIRVLDFQTRKSLTELAGHTGGVMSLKFHENILLSASRDRTVKMWDVTTGRCVSTFSEHNASVWCLDWDGGSLAVSGSEDTLVKIWDLRTGNCIHSFNGHAKGIGSISFNEFYIASGSRDKTIMVWDHKMQSCVHTLKGHTNSVRCLKFDDKRVVSGSWDNTIKIWDIQSGDCIRTLQGHNDRVLTLQFDDDKIVSGGFDQTIKVWNLHTGDCMHTLQGHNYPLAHVQFDESKIRSGSRDLTIKIWDFSFS